MDPSLEKLRRILDLERKQGFADQAVIGGLEGFISNWVDEAASRLDREIVSGIGEELHKYGSLPPEERESRVSAVEELAASAGPRESKPKVPRQTKSTDRSGADAPSHGGRAEKGPTRESGDRESVGKKAGAPDDGSQAEELRMEDDPKVLRPVIHLRGFGKKSADRLERLGILTIRDLLLHAPSRYNDFRNLKTISRLRIGEEATIVGTVWEVRRRRGRNVRDVMTVVLSDTTAKVACTFFNQPYLEKQFPVGRRIVVSGKVESWSGRPTFRSPEWERLDRELVHTGRLVPVYPLTRGITQRWLRGRMMTVVSQWADRMGDPLPAGVRDRYELITLPDALRALHFPADEADIDRARRRLAFDELLTLQLWMRRRRSEWQSLSTFDLSEGSDAVDEFVASLPFRLTGAQERCLKEVSADLSSGTPMNRLLQGDVGSGKTVVAAAAMVMAVSAGTQAALMAPTEILSEQHFRALVRLLEPVGYTTFSAEVDADRESSGSERGPRLARLVGSMRSAEKERVRSALASGEVDLLVGTHALIQEAVRFRRLGVAVVDEQHRFGVLQRAELPARSSEGGETAEEVPHVLIMSATPIPRTLSKVLLADLDQSVIDELPPGRKPIQTRWLRPREAERAYQFIRHRAAQGEQAYIVYPLVEESESIEAKSAVAEYERLRSEVFPDLALGLVHGRMPSDEKEAAMRAFVQGETQVLVATSVIEVGVDVPNATVMMIDGADRFGLAQLHQFRGRVGRGDSASECVLVSDASSTSARMRLEAIVAVSDGLELASRDLEMRGPGDYFGVRQSGVVDRFRFAREASASTLADASEAAHEISLSDPGLTGEEHRALSHLVDEYSTAAERA